MNHSENSPNINNFCSRRDIVCEHNANNEYLTDWFLRMKEEAKRKHKRTQCSCVFMFANDSLPTVWYIGQVNFLVYAPTLDAPLLAEHFTGLEQRSHLFYSLIITGQIDIYIFARLPRRYLPPPS